MKTAKQVVLQQPTRLGLTPDLASCPTTRRDALRAMGAWGMAAALPGAAWARDASEGLLPMATSLPDALAAALAAREPLVVMVSLPGCPYCPVVRQSYLAPLLASGQARVVQIDMLGNQSLVAMDRSTTSHGQQVRAWQVKVAPTVLFFGAQARELAPRINGVGVIDFYGAYLDERLATARKALRA